MATTKLNTRDTQGHFNLDTSTEPLLTGVNVLKTGQDSLQYLLSGMKWLKSNTFPIIGINDLSNNYLSRWDDTNGKFINSLIYDNGTNVGIGITTPFAKLTLPSGTIGMIGFEYAVNASSRRWWIHNDYYNYGDFSILTETNKGQSAPNLSRLYIDPSGNVGINTTNPSYKLDVNGSIRGTSLTSGGSIILPLGDDLLWGGGYTSNHPLIVGNTSGLHFYGYGAGGGEQLTIKSDGNVGIGVANPSEKLDVNGYIKALSGFKKGSLDDTRMLLAGGGDKLISDFETPASVDTKIANALSSLLTYKGSKATFGDLPVSGNKIGDTWNVQDAYFSFPAGTNFTWDGSAWDGLGGIIGIVTQTVAGLMSAADKTKLDGIAANAISAITKAMVEAVLTGTITTHTHLGLIRVSQLKPLGLLHWDDFVRFDRQAGYCQVSLTEIESVIDSTSHDIEFTNYTLDIDDNSGLYNNGGSFRVVEERTYELSATVGIYTIAGKDLTFALQLINYSDSGSIIKERIFEVSAANNWITLDISALVKYKVDTDIGLRIETPNTSYDIIPDNRTWFSVHEIK